jgi:hypothetical protein
MKLLSNYKHIILFVATITIVSCNRPMKQDKLMKYISEPKHGLLQEKKTNGIIFMAIYRPSDLMAAQELRAYSSYSRQFADSIKAIYNKYLYFLISMSYNNQELLNSLSGNQQQFGEMVNRLSFEMNDYILLTTSNNDTLKLIDYSYPRMYGTGTSTDLLFAFERFQLGQAGELYLKLSDFGIKTGDVVFTFKSGDLHNVPVLEMELLKTAKAKQPSNNK